MRRTLRRPHRRRARVAAWALAGALTIPVGGTVGQAFRTAAPDPPGLFVEGPDRVAAGEPFELRLSADRPVTFELSLAGEERTLVDQAATVALSAPPGVHDATVVATDAAGAQATSVHAVEAVAVPEVRLEVPDRVPPGAPFVVTVVVDPSDAPLEGPTLREGDRTVPLHGPPGARWGLAGAPLQVEEARTELVADWRDGLGRPHEARVSVLRAALEREVQELNVPANVLAVATNEARAEQDRALDEARAAVVDPPRWTEPFLIPIEGRGSSGFGVPRRYAPGGRVSFHLGEDIAAETGTPIRATNVGVVRIAAYFGIAGYMTVLDHGAGVTSRYYHQSRIDVQVGQIVRRGDVIGAVGSTGLSTGPHLHWEMRIDEVPTDPLAWVGRVLP